METAATADKTEVANAISALRLAGLDNGLLEEIELDGRLRISLEQADKGLGRPIEEFQKELDQKFASGYFSKENAEKRMEKSKWKMTN